MSKKKPEPKPADPPTPTPEVETPAPKPTPVAVTPPKPAVSSPPDKSASMMNDALGYLNRDAMITPNSPTPNPMAKALRHLNAPSITPRTPKRT